MSVASLLCGVVAGAFFWRGTPVAALAAAAAYFAGNVFDCADGQLARLQGASSPVGYLVDGAADYIGTIAVFVGMTHALAVSRPAAVSWWWLAVPAGASMAWQCAFLDEKRGAWQDRVYARRRDRAQEIAAMTAQARLWRQEGTHAGSRALVAAYRLYRTAWSPVTKDDGELERDETVDARWAERHRPVLRRSVWVGPTMHVTAIVVVGGVFFRPDVYFWLAVGPANLWMLWTLAGERRADRRAQRAA